MINEIWKKLIELFGQSFYNLPYSLRIIWQIVGAIFAFLLSLSIINIFYILFVSSKLFLLKIVIRYKNWYKKLDFKRFIKKSKHLYQTNIPKLNLIYKQFGSKKIGGFNALIQTNWQFKKKKDKKYVVREPEELGFREVLDSNSLVNLALAGWIEIKEIYLCTDEEVDYEDSYYVDITFKNTTGREIYCTIPKGQIFENDDINSNTQNLAARDELRFNIAADSNDKRIIVPSYCLNKTMARPNGKSGKVTIFEVMIKNFDDQTQLWRLIDRQNMLIDADGYTSNSKPDLIKSIIHASAQLQGLGKTLRHDEDSRNGFIASVLNNKGFKAKDQSRWGASEKGERTGEIDIKIDDDENDTISLCEAFNLEYKNTTVISSHLKKIFTYDVNGVSRNFILVYAMSNDFADLWSKYLSVAQELEYPYVLSGELTDVSLKHSKYSDIKVALGLHQRNDTLSELYHIFINMNFVK